MIYDDAGNVIETARARWRFQGGITNTGYRLAAIGRGLASFSA